MKPTQKDLIDTDGENRAVRAFLLGREVGCKDYEQMRRHMTNSGFDNCWPSEFASLGGHMSKAAQQMWLRHLFALERFGAGSGEPVARLMKWVRDGLYIKKGHIIARTYEECPKDTYLDGWEEAAELYTHPSPTDLRAEYERGLEDAAKVARAGYDEFWKRHDPEFPKARYDQASVLRTLHATVEFISTDIAEAIRALKGK